MTKFYRRNTGSVHMIAAPRMILGAMAAPQANSKVLFTDNLLPTEFEEKLTLFKAQAMGNGTFEYIFPPHPPTPTLFNRPTFPEVKTMAQYDEKSAKEKREILKDRDEAEDKAKKYKGKAWASLIEAVEPRSTVSILVDAHKGTCNTAEAMQSITDHFTLKDVESREGLLQEELSSLPTLYAEMPQNAAAVKKAQKHINDINTQLTKINEALALSKIRMIKLLESCLRGELRRDFDQIRLAKPDFDMNQLADKVYMNALGKELTKAARQPSKSNPVAFSALQTSAPSTYLGKRKFDNTVAQPVIHKRKTYTNKYQRPNSKHYRHNQNYHRKTYGPTPNPTNRAPPPKHMRRPTSLICNRCKKPGHLAKNCKTRLGNYARYGMRANVTFQDTKHDPSTVPEILRESEPPSKPGAPTENGPVELYCITATNQQASSAQPAIHNDDAIESDEESVPPLVDTVWTLLFAFSYSHLLLEAFLCADSPIVYLRFRHCLTLGLPLNDLTPNPYRMALCVAPQLPGDIVVYGDGNALRAHFDRDLFIFNGANPIGELVDSEHPHPSYTANELADMSQAYTAYRQLDDATAITQYIDAATAALGNEVDPNAYAVIFGEQDGHVHLMMARVKTVVRDLQGRPVRSTTTGGRDGKTVRIIHSPYHQAPVIRNSPEQATILQDIQSSSTSVAEALTSEAALTRAIPNADDPAPRTPSPPHPNTDAAIESAIAKIYGWKIDMNIHDVDEGFGFNFDSTPARILTSRDFFSELCSRYNLRNHHGDNFIELAVFFDTANIRSDLCLQYAERMTSNEDYSDLEKIAVRYIQSFPQLVCMLREITETGQDVTLIINQLSHTLELHPQIEITISKPVNSAYFLQALITTNATRDKELNWIPGLNVLEQNMEEGYLHNATGVQRLYLRILRNFFHDASHSSESARNATRILFESFKITNPHQIAEWWSENPLEILFADTMISTEEFQAVRKQVHSCWPMPGHRFEAPHNYWYPATDNTAPQNASATDKITNEVIQILENTTAIERSDLVEWLFSDLPYMQHHVGPITHLRLSSAIQLILDINRPNAASEDQLEVLARLLSLIRHLPEDEISLQLDQEYGNLRSHNLRRAVKAYSDQLKTIQEMLLVKAAAHSDEESAKESAEESAGDLDSEIEFEQKPMAESATVMMMKNSPVDSDDEEIVTYLGADEATPPGPSFMLHQPKRQRQDTPIPPKQADYSTSSSPEPTEPTTLSTENPTEQPTAHIIHRPVLVPNNPKVSEATQLHRQASIVGKGVQLEVYTEAVNRLINQGIAQDVPSATKCLYDIVNSSGYIRHDENHKTFSRRQGVQAHRLFGLEAPVVFIPPCDNALCTAASHPRGDPINFNFSPETPTGEIYYKVISSHLHYLPSPDATHQRQTIRRARVAVEGCMVGYTHLIPTKGILRYLYQQKQKQHWRLHVEPLNTSLPLLLLHHECSPSNGTFATVPDPQWTNHASKTSLRHYNDPRHEMW